MEESGKTNGGGTFWTVIYPQKSSILLGNMRYDFILLLIKQIKWSRNPMNKDVIRNTSIIKTLIFNKHYFGWGGVIHPRCLVSKQVCFRALSGRVIVDEQVPIGGIKIGFGDVGIIDRKYERSIWENYGTVEFKGKARLGLRTRIACKGNLIFGKDTCMNSGADIICWKAIIFGDKCLVSWDTLFMDTDFHRISPKDNSNLQINPNKDIIIGNHVWIGCRTTVLKGSRIPNNSIIGAGSVVRSSLKEENAIYINEEVVRERVEW